MKCPNCKHDFKPDAKELASELGKTGGRKITDNSPKAVANRRRVRKHRANKLKK